MRIPQVVEAKKPGPAQPHTPSVKDSTPLSGPGAASGTPLFLQTRLMVGAPHDQFEREADHVAQQVTSGGQASAITPVGPSTLRRMPAGPTPCDDCEQEEPIQAKAVFPTLPELGKEPPKPEAASAAQPEAASAADPALDDKAAAAAKAKEPADKVHLPNVEPSPAEEEVPVQTQRVDPSAALSPDAAAHRPGQAALPAALARSQGRGSPLPPAIRSTMERRFGRDLSGVRIHTDSAAVQMNHDLQARAFTHKNDIYFNANEYAPSSPEGTRLLAHELTHTVQQGAAGHLIQRWSAPDQTVTVEPRPAKPDDGDEVTSRVNQRIEDDENVQDQDDLSDEEREEKKHPDRKEVRRESSQLQASGETKPSVDRGAQAEEKTSDQKEQLQQELQQQPPEAGGEKPAGVGKKAPLTPAQAAAQRAQLAQAQAYAVPIPKEPQPFRHPRIEAPVDSAGEPLPRNGQIDTRVRGLGHIGEMLRAKGYAMKGHAARQTIASYGLQAVVEREREDLARARQGVATMQTHNEARAEIAAKSHQAHGESVERQQFVAAKAPDMAAKADEGRADSSALAADARAKADRSQSELPDDEDSRGDAEKQSGDMQDTAQGAASMDQAIRQSGERARQYEADAAAAAEQNEQSEARINETDDLIAQTQARITDMQASNEASQAQIDKASAGPARIRQFARRDAQSGDELIAATVVMEDELQGLQEEYLAGMSQIESRKDAIERQKKQEEADGKAELSPDERQLFDLAGMSEREQEEHIAGLSQSQRTGLLATLERMIQTMPDQGTDETEGARFKVDTGLAQAITGEPPPDPRAEQIQTVENRRIQRVGGVLDVADKNMTFLTAEQQRMLANKLVAASITDDIKNINVLQMGEGMLKGMINPFQSLAGVAGGFDKMLTGFANIGNWEAWRKDPLGNLLQVAADITTGLASIFSSILGLAALITAAMVALTIISWGTLSFITVPVISWMGTVMTFAGWGAMITGGLAVYFNYLAYLKNLHDAGTAETARGLFGNVDQMKQNATDGFQGAMAVVEGVGAVKMGAKIKSGEFFEHIPHSPGDWARQTAQRAKNMGARLVSAPGRIGRGVRDLLAGGKQGLLRFKERIQGLFGRRRPGRPGEVEPPATPQAQQTHQTHLDEARGKRVRDMEPAEFNAEMREAGKNRPRRVEPGSEHFRDYDVEVQAGEHTYRRRRDGRGWCRFSPGPGECGIADANLPPKVRDEIRDLEPATTRPTEETTPTQQPALEQAPPRRTPTLDPHQKSVLGEIADDLEAHGLDWEEIGLRGPEDIDGFLARYADVDEGIAELNRRLDARIDMSGTRAGLEGRGVPSGRPEPGLRSDYLERADRADRLEGSSVFGRANEVDTSRMLNQNLNNVADQVRVRPILDSGQPADFYFIVDHLGESRAGGQLLAFESKISAGAPLTPNQTVGYPLLSRNGGFVESRSAGVFAQGTRLPPTQSFRVQPRIDPRTGGFGAGPRGFKFRPLGD